MKTSNHALNLLAAAFGVIAYFIGIGTILYFIGFVDGVVVPKSVDIGGATGDGALATASIDGLLVALFGFQHSVMARPAFKKMWTRFVPATIERSTYVLFSSAALGVLMWLWHPMEGIVWQLGTTGSFLAIVIGCVGWVLLFLSTFLINHCELFGLRQTFAKIFGYKDAEPSFRTPFLYRVVRHPLYLGLVLAMWAAPKMTLGHLLFSLLMTTYIFFAISLEETDLIHVFGKSYLRYRERVGMLFPRIWRRQ